MSEFLKIPISEIGTTITGKTPSSENLDDFGDRYMFVTPSDNLDSKFIFETNRYLSDTGMEKLKSKLLPSNSLLVSCIGSAMGKVTMNKFPCITNQQINSIVVNQKYDADYLYYRLKNSYEMLRNAALGSTALPMLNKTDFDNLEIAIHKNNTTQQKIAAVLSSLDSKIELNNKINNELEAMAKTLYDYWFVQFDFPDSDGKPYKTSGGKMVWNDKLKIEIPDGWEVKKIGSAFNTYLGGTPSTSVPEYWNNGTISWLNSGEIANFPIIDSELKITETAISNSATTLLPKGSVLLSITRHLRPSVLAIDACANQSVVGIKEKEDFKYYYLYPYLQNEIPRLNTMRSGAQQPHINKEIVDESLIVIPSSSILKMYNLKVAHIYELIMSNAFENQTLSELSDWLLPMLMNGQVTVN